MAAMNVGEAPQATSMPPLVEEESDDEMPSLAEEESDGESEPESGGGGAGCCDEDSSCCSSEDPNEASNALTDASNVLGFVFARAARGAVFPGLLLATRVSEVEAKEAVIEAAVEATVEVVSAVDGATEETETIVEAAVEAVLEAVIGATIEDVDDDATADESRHIEASGDDPDEGITDKNRRKHRLVLTRDVSAGDVISIFPTVLVVDNKDIVHVDAGDIKHGAITVPNPGAIRGKQDDFMSRATSITAPAPFSLQLGRLRILHDGRRDEVDGYNAHLVEMEPHGLEEAPLRNAEGTDAWMATMPNLAIVHVMSGLVVLMATRAIPEGTAMRCRAGALLAEEIVAETSDSIVHTDAFIKQRELELRSTATMTSWLRFVKGD